MLQNKRFLNEQDVEKLVKGFIVSRLDHCNSVFTALLKKRKSDTIQ